MRAEFRRAQRRKGLLESTIERRELDLRAFETWLVDHDKTWADATRRDVEQWLDRPPLRPGRPRASARTRYNAISNLHVFFQWAVREEYLTHDPTVLVDRPKLRPGLPRPTRDEDLVHALRSADPLRRSWIILGAFAGLRCAEIAGLHREDILETEGLLRVMGKGRKERLVPLHELVLPALRVVGLPRSGHIFVRDDGRPWGADQLSRNLAVFFKAINVDSTAHNLRHWFATNTYRASSSDLRVVQELLGHSSPTTTAVYTAFSRPAAAKAVRALEIPDAGDQELPDAG